PGVPYAVFINGKDEAMEKDKDTVKDTARDKSIGAVLGDIEKQFGKGAIMRLGAAGDPPAPGGGVGSAGSLGLGLPLGTGGLPRGRIGEVYGPESSGKTTLALHVL